MSADLLSGADIIVNVAYISFVVHALIRDRQGSLASLIKACQSYWTGVALAALGVVIDVASLPSDGWGELGMGAFTLAVAILGAVLAERRRDRKVVEEMWRDLS